MNRSDNNGNIKRLFENLCVTTSKEMDHRVLDDAFAVLKELAERKSFRIEPSTRKIVGRRIAKFASAAVIIAAALIGVKMVISLGKEPSPQVVKQQDMPDTKYIVETKSQVRLAEEKLEVELKNIERMFAAGDVDGLVAALGKGEFESKAVAANYLAKIGDLRAIGALEELSRQWQGDDASNPFLRAIEEIKKRLKQQEQTNKNDIRQEGAKIDRTDTENTFVLRVVSKDTNKPMEEVQLDIKVDKEKSKDTTDNEGQCRIIIGEANSLSIKVQEEGFVPMKLSYRKDENTTCIPRSHILALEKATSIGGFVKNEEEKPIEGVKVSFMAFGDSKYERVHTRKLTVRTDSKGYWQCDIVPAKLETIRFELKHPDYMPVTVDIGARKRLWFMAGDDQSHQVCVLSAESLRDMTGVLTMKRGLTVSGRVLNLKGEPIKDASVMCNRSQSTKTDADGKFSFNKVAPGKVVLTAQADGYAPNLKEINVSEDVPSVQFHLESGYTIRGRVADSEDRPIKDAHIGASFWRGYRTLRTSVKTDSDGRFVWKDAPKDKVLFHIIKEGYMSVYDFPMSATTNEHVITIYKTLEIKGEVIDADSNEPIDNFQLIPGIKFESSDLAYWLRDNAVSFTDGRYKYTFESEYDGYFIRIEAHGYIPEISHIFYCDEENAVFDFALKKGIGSGGTIYLPDGEPADGAEVIICTASRQGKILGGKNMDKNNSVFVVSGADGRFSLPPQVEDYLLVILHDKGYAEITEKELATDPNIVLDTWGRLEGMLHIGRKIGANEKIWWYRNRNMFRQEAIPVWHSCDTVTDANGHFVFEKLPPDKITVYHVVESGRYSSGRGSSKTLEIIAGQTAKINLGGAGRPVTGRLTVPTGYKGIIDWNFGDNTLDLILPKYPHPKNLDFLTGNERNTWQRIWQKSDKSKAYTEAHQEHGRTYGVKIEDNGTFRIEDVIPGSYVLRLRLYNRPKDDPYGFGDAIGAVNYEFQVPDMNEGYNDEPLDIGTIELELKKSLRVGDFAPPFELENLSGKLIQLANYSDKFVLINFWISLHPKCTEEILSLKKIYNRYSPQKRLVIIGLSLDYYLEDAEKFIKDNGLEWTNCFLSNMPEETVAKDYGLDRLPYTILIGPDGKIIAINPSVEQLESILNQLVEKHKPNL